MPEGDTIHRTAINLRKVLNGQQIESASSGDDRRNVESLCGAVVTGIEARGKHLVLHFTGDRAVHSHMGMTGSWHIYHVDQSWQKQYNLAALVLNTALWCVVCFTPKLIELVSERELLWNNWLRKLGPDLLGPPIVEDIYLSRFRTQNSQPIGEVLLNQTVVCGIGNVYKSEILFLENVSPAALVADLSNDQLLKLRDRAVFLMSRNMDSVVRQTRFHGGGQRMWVYGRRGSACLKCGDTIRVLKQGIAARSTYWCPTCQGTP